jgi:hypothetical protein
MEIQVEVDGKFGSHGAVEGKVGLGIIRILAVFYRMLWGGLWYLKLGL